MYIRPVQASDAHALQRLAEQSGIGVTSLPANQQKMQAKLDLAMASFAQTIPQEDRLYLFTLVDETTDTAVGICALEASIGHQDVWYNYRVGKSVHASPNLGIHKTTQTLYLVNDLTGSSEIATLFLLPEYRGKQNGQLLSRCRYLFLAEFPELFNETIIAEMRGVSDAQGRSPFWDSLGKHFFDMDFSDADYLTGLGNKVFIAELMPKYPIYVTLLSDAAQAAIGKVHPQTEPALAMLKTEGFDYNGYVDIFDGGPSLSAKVADIRAVKHSKLAEVIISDKVALPDLAQKQNHLLVSNRQLQDFRTLLCHQNALQGKQLTLNKQQAKLLNISAGDSTRVVALRPTEGAK